MADPEIAPSAESTAAPAAESQPSFADALTAAQPSLTQAEHDAKLAEARTGWETDRDKSLGWAKDIPAEQGPRIAKLFTDLEQNPVGALMHLLRAAGQNPANQAAILQQIQQFLPSAGAASANTATPPPAQRAAEPPGPDLVIEAHTDPDTGKIIPERRMYSDVGWEKREAWLIEKMTGMVNETMKPVLSFQEQQQQAQQQFEAERQADAMAGEVMTDLSSRPLFNESKKEIAAEISRLAKSYPGGVIPDSKLPAVARDAYLNVVTPKLSERGQTAALATHALKASAGTARPTVGAAATPSTPKDGDLRGALRAHFKAG